MKLRIGYISNSSTTSFIVAICKKIDPRDEEMIGVFEDLLESWDDETEKPMTQKLPINKFCDDINDSINKLKDNVAFLNGEIEEAKRIIEDDNVMFAVQKYLDMRGTINGVSITHRKDIIGRIKKTAKESFECEIASLRGHLKKHEEKILEYDKKLQLIEKLKNRTDIKYLVFFDLSGSFGGKMENRIRMLIDKGVVELIERETN